MNIVKPNSFAVIIIVQEICLVVAIKNMDMFFDIICVYFCGMIFHNIFLDGLSIPDFLYRL